MAFLLSHAPRKWPQLERVSITSSQLYLKMYKLLELGQQSFLKAALNKIVYSKTNTRVTWFAAPWKLRSSTKQTPEMKRCAATNPRPSSCLFIELNLELMKMLGDNKAESYVFVITVGITCNKQTRRCLQIRSRHIWKEQHVFRLCCNSFHRSMVVFIFLIVWENEIRLFRNCIKMLSPFLCSRVVIVYVI